MRSAASPREVRVHRGSGGKGRTRVRAPRVRTGMPSVALTKAEFVKRFRARFYDPAFEREGEAIAAAAEVAWNAYQGDRKSPRTKPAGAGFADPTFELPLEWLATRHS